MATGGILVLFQFPACAMWNGILIETFVTAEVCFLRSPGAAAFAVSGRASAGLRGRFSVLDVLRRALLRALCVWVGDMSMRVRTGVTKVLSVQLET